MADFVRGQESISGDTLHIRTNDYATFGLREPISKIGDGRELAVVPDKQGIVKITKDKSIQNNVRGYRVDGIALGSVTLEAKPLTGDDEKNMTYGPTSDSITIHVVQVAYGIKPLTTANRDKIIEIATGFKGSHYVWGAAGACPGHNNGMPTRMGGVVMEPNNFDPLNPCINAASFDIGGQANSKHVCAGRSSECPGAREFTSTELAQSLKEWKEEGPDMVSVDRVWPRKLLGYTNRNEIVWGEDCRGVRHFDCIGFINYCLSDALQGGIQMCIDQYIAATVNVDSKTVIAADILTQGNHHIGFATGAGTVVHASETKRGVVIDTYTAGAWRVGRLPSAKS